MAREQINYIKAYAEDAVRREHFDVDEIVDSVLYDMEADGLNADRELVQDVVEKAYGPSSDAFEFMAMLKDCSGNRKDAERALRNGSTVFEASEFEQHLASYMGDLFPGAEEDEINAVLDMVHHDIPMPDWSVLKLSGEKVYIMYVH